MSIGKVNDCNLLELVVVESSDSAKLDSLGRDTSYKLKIPLDDCFIKHSPNTYSVLLSKDVTKHLKIRNGVFIETNGVVNKIELVDVDPGQYILSLNNINCATAKYNDTTKMYEFDFSKPKSKMLQTYINILKTNDCKFDDGNDYLPFARIDTAKINGLKCKYGQIIRYHGWFPTNVECTTWNNDIHEQIIYGCPYYYYTLNLKNVTESLEIYFSNEKNDSKHFIIYMDGKKYIDNPFNDNCVTLFFKNNTDFYNGIQNKYLNENINKMTLNLTRVGSIKIVANCKIRKVVQNFYETYDYPNRVKLFV